MLLGHFMIEGRIKCLTGLHIGASSDTIDIGGIDSPVIRNPVDRMPYIPGSSLKGKMRCMMERKEACEEDCLERNMLKLLEKGDYREARYQDHFNRDGGGGCLRHECENSEDACQCRVCSLFGSTGRTKKDTNFPSPLIVWDGELYNKSEMTRDGLLITEAKMENTIDRITAAAHPRTIERVPAGAIFTMKLVLRIQKVTMNGAVTWKEHLKNIILLLSLLEKDGLGGSISRGYGQVEIFLSRFEGEMLSGKKVGGLSFNKRGYSFDECSKSLDNINYEEAVQ